MVDAMVDSFVDELLPYYHNNDDVITCMDMYCETCVFGYIQNEIGFFRVDGRQTH